MAKAFKAQRTLSASGSESRYPVDPEGVETTRGLLIGFAISQVLWIGIALLVF